MASLWGAKLLLAAALLVAGVVTDLRSRKVPNRLLLGALILFISAILVIDGISGIWPAIGSAFSAVVCIIPLYILRAIGGGDAKLLLVTALILPWEIAITMVFYAMLWGSVLGLVRALISGQGRALAGNMILILKGKKPAPQQLHQIPFAVAIFLGFLSATTLTSLGVVWF